MQPEEPKSDYPHVDANFPDINVPPTTRPEVFTPPTPQDVPPAQAVPAAPVEAVPSPVQTPPVQPQVVTPADTGVSQPLQATQPPVNPQGIVAGMPVEPPQKKPGFFARFKSKKFLLLAVALPLLVAGGGAAAYYGVVVPNQPDNVLKAAFANTLQEKQIRFDGVVDISAVDQKKSGAMTATSVTFKGGSNTETGALQAQIDMTMSGVKVTSDMRYVDQAMYFKFGDLSTVKGLMGSYGKALSPLIDKVQNQWIELDKTLLTQAGADCFLNQKIAFTKADMQLLSDAYDKYKFVTITSTASEKVGSIDTVKYELAIDDNKAADSLSDMQKLSAVSSLKSCDKNNATSLSDAQKELRDGDSTPLTVWIDTSSKRIVKLASHSTEQDAKKDNIKGTASIVLAFDAVSVEKPAGAKPFMTLLSELQDSSSGLLGGQSGASSLLSQNLFE